MKQNIYGHHAVIAALQNPARKNTVLHHSRALTPELAEAVKGANVKLRAAKKGTLDALFPHAVHQGVVLETYELREGNLNAALQSKLVVALDQVTDPHNLGAILRSCAAFNVAAVLVPKANNSLLTPAATKAAGGAAECVPLISVNLAQTLQKFQKAGFYTIGMAGKAEQTLAEAAADVPNMPKVLVMGSEGDGLRPLVAKNCDALAKLPINSGDNGVESLNVSVAAGISLYEVSARA